MLGTRLPDGAQRLLPDPAAAPELNEAASAALADDETRTVKVGNADWFLHVYNPPLRLIVVGAVHIAQALVPFAAATGFAVIVVDPRRAFATDERFPNVTVSTEWPDEAMAALRPDVRTAVVTLTHDPKLDDPALDHALKSPGLLHRRARLTENPRGAAEAAARAGPQRPGAGAHPRPGRAEHRGGDRAGDRAVDHRRGRRRASWLAAGTEAGGMTIARMRRERDRPALTSPALAGEVGERSDTGEGGARGTTLTLGASRLDLSRQRGRGKGRRRAA